MGSINPFQILLASNTIGDFFTRSNYLRVVQRHDKKLVYDTVQAKNDYSNQQQIFEDKKKLNVMVKIFGRNTPVELSYMQVEKLD